MSEKAKANGTTLWITARIHSAEQVATTKDNFPVIESIVTLPAPDLHTAPKRLCIRSTSKLGQPGEDITLEVQPIMRSSYNKDTKKTFYYHQLEAVK